MASCRCRVVGASSGRSSRLAPGRRFDALAFSAAFVPGGKTDATGLPLTGQSDDSYNLTVYYEDDVFSTRLAYSYRGEFNTRNSSSPVGVRYRDETANLDFSASYQVNDNLRLTLEGINLTDEPQIDYLWPEIGGLLIETQYTGTQWFIGASYLYN